MKEFIDKLIERLEESKERYEDVAFFEMNTNGHTLDFEYSHGKEDGVLEAIEIVNQLAEEYNNGWIPCSERLPETDKNRKYLVCGKNGGIYIAEFVCKSVSNESIGPWWSASGRYAPEPIAWQPLPESYKKIN